MLSWNIMQLACWKTTLSNTTLEFDSIYLAFLSPDYTSMCALDVLFLQNDIHGFLC
jgi:hypothetical protein